jgi:putative Holliday junction resolvase
VNRCDGPAPGREPPATIPARGALIGIDFGTVRIGLAISDPDRIIASPLATYARRSDNQDVEYFRKTVAEHRACGAIVGLPLHADGRESPISLEARRFGDWLRRSVGLLVIYWDERFTTSLADDALLGARLTKKQRDERRDRVAAQMILQNYLDAGCPPEGTILADPEGH